MKSRAFVSWSTLFFRDPLGPFGRLASLLFDELYLQINAEHLERVLERATRDGEIDANISRELGRIWKPIDAAIPNYRMFDRNPWDDPTPGLVDTAHQVVVEATLRETPQLGLPEERAGFQHEVAWATAGLVEAVAVWSAVNALGPCSFATSDREHKVVEQVFSAVNPNPDVDVFGSVLSASVPDVSTLSWNRIIDLRNNPFLESFRSKVSEIQDISRGNDPQSIRELALEMERRDLHELARQVRPTAATSVLKALVSNVPLPIPVNPASIGLSLIEVVQAYKRKERFGWIYFMLDVGATDLAVVGKGESRGA